jgi:hypothetical protein
MGGQDGAVPSPAPSKGKGKVVRVIRSDDEVSSSSDDNVPLQRWMRARDRCRSMTGGPPSGAPMPRPASLAAARAMVPGGSSGSSAAGVMVATKRAATMKEAADAATTKEVVEEAAKKKKATEEAAKKKATEAAVTKKKAAKVVAKKKATEVVEVKKKAAPRGGGEEGSRRGGKKEGLRGGGKEDHKCCGDCGLQPISGLNGRSQEGGYTKWLYTSGQAAIPRLLETSVHYAILHLPLLVPCLRF